MSGFFTRLVALTWLAVFMCAMVVSSSPTPTAKNHQLMKKLGLSKRPVSPSHYRKRLASESRGSNADSHMFIIKLPPNPYFYSHHKPVNHIHSMKKLSMGFRSNGKTSKIYHWNIPLLNKMAAAGRRHTSRLSDVDNDVISVKILKPVSQTSIQNRHSVTKPVRPVGNVRKPVKVKPALSIYSPAPTHKPKIYKYISSNGKPQSIYVINKSKNKPIKYQRLLT